MVTLDSKAGDSAKPAIRDALLKMGSFLVELDESVHLSEWSSVSNRNKMFYNRPTSLIVQGAFL